MASALPAMLHEEFLTCKICYESFRSPKILTCLHSFCAACLEAHVKQQGDGETVLCPLCRQPTPIPSHDQGGINGLKDNFFLASLQAAVGQAPGCDSCVARGEARPALTHCQDCEENLCDDCLHAHQRLTLTKNHLLTPIGETPQQVPPAAEDTGDAAAPPVVQLPCPQHPTEDSKLYCHRCAVPVCVTCKLTTHEGHKCVGLHEAASQQKASLHRLLETVSGRVGEYEKIIEDWTKYRAMLDKQQQALQAKIDRRREELRTLVSGWHYATSQQLNSTYEAERKHIVAKLDMVEVQLSTHRSVCQLATSILEQAPQPQVLKLKDQITADVSNLQRHNLNALCLTQRSVLTFNVGCQSLNFDHFGAFVLSHEKVISSVRVKPEQHITLVNQFRTRSDGEKSSSQRFDTSSVSITSSGNIIVADRQLDRIGIFTQGGEVIRIISTTAVGKPICAAVASNGDITFSRDKHSICVYSSKGKAKKSIKDNLSKPCGISLGPGDNKTLYVLDYHTKTVTKYDENYVRIGHVKLSYRKSSMWDRVAVNSQGNLFVLCYAESCVIEFTADGEKLAEMGRWGSSAMGSGDLYWPRGFCIDTHDNIIIADTHNDRLQLLSPCGTWTLLQPTDVYNSTNISGKATGSSKSSNKESVTPSGLYSPTDVAVTQCGKLCVLEKNGIVKIFEYLPY